MPLTSTLPKARTLRSQNRYTGSISLAGVFSGNKDVTITAVNTAKARIVPVKSASIVGVASLHLFFFVPAQFDSSQGSCSSIDFASSTIVRFTVANGSGSSINLLYDFIVEEYF